MSKNEIPAASASQQGQPNRPPLPLRLLGQGLSFAIASRPRTWRFLRRPTQRFWERSAASWDQRIAPDRAEHLAPLAAGANGSTPSRGRSSSWARAPALSRACSRRFPAARIRAVDLSSAMIGAARANVPLELSERIELEIADAAALPYHDQMFDLVAQLNMPVYLPEAGTGAAAWRPPDRGQQPRARDSVLHAQRPAQQGL